MTKKLSLLAGLGGLWFSTAALADDGLQEHPDAYSYAWSEPGLQSGVGVGVTLGGGISGFTDQSMRNTASSSVGGLWGLHVSIGTHVPIGVDLNYIGTATNMKPLGTDNGTLVGTTFEGALRYNILPHFSWTPYVFAGIGYQRYDLTSAHLAQSDSGMKSSDNIAVFPMGAGISYRDTSGFVVDLRGTFRAAMSSTLVLDPVTNKFDDLHTVEGSANLGYEF